VHLLDGELIARARVRLGYPAYVVSRSLGVSTEVVDRLETGSDQRNLSVGFIVDLADTLGVTVAELCVTPTSCDASTDPDVVATDDVAAVGALLSTAGATVSVDAIAVALGWTLERTLLALDGLDRSLPGIGQRLAWLNTTHVAVCPAPVDVDTATVVARRSLAETGVNSDEATVMLKVLEHQSVAAVTANPVTVNRLYAAGFLEFADNDAAGRPNRAVLTDAATFNLVLDDGNGGSEIADTTRSGSGAD